MDILRIKRDKAKKKSRETEGLVSKMLRGAGHSDLSKVLLYLACNGYLQLLRYYFILAAAVDTSKAFQISRKADNIHWLLDVPIDRQIADELLRIWAAQAEISELHSKVSVIHPYEVRRVTARLFVGIEKGQVLVSKVTRSKTSKAHTRSQAKRVLVLKLACQVFVGIPEQEVLLV